MDGTILQQGTFISDGAAKILQIRSDVDFMWVYNYTNAGATGDDSVKFYWQRGMSDGTGVRYFKSGGGNTLNMTTLADPNGFILVDTSLQTLGSTTALTGMTAANPPVVTSAGHGLAVGDIVRFSSMDNQPQINGLDFTVTASGATFTVGNINLANSTASTAGFWRKIVYQPNFYPRRRYITYISQASVATQAKIYMSVTHDFTVGQKVRLSLPGGTGVWENFAALDGRLCTIVAINQARAGNEPNNGGTANNIVVDVDVSSLGNWNVFGAANNQGYPASSLVPFSPAQVIPVGENTAQALSSNEDILDDATLNTAYIGMKLPAGSDAPGGASNDVLYWVAGKSFSNTTA